MSSFYPPPCPVLVYHFKFLFTVARFLCRPPGLEFRENSRERGPRSSENRSQGLRPPWGVQRFTTAKRRSRAGWKPQREPSSGRRRTPRAGGCGARDSLGRETSGIAVKVRAQSGKKPGCRGKSGRVCRETAHSGRVSGGSRGAVPGGNRENRAAAARRRRLPAGFCRENSGAAGRKRRVSGLWMAKRGEKSPRTAGFGRKTGRGSAYSGRRVTGSLFFQSRAPDAIPFAPI